MFKTINFIFLFTSIVMAQSNHPQWKTYFDECHVNGCIVIYDENKQEYHQYNSARCDSAYLPASTFKLLNSFIALETQVLADETQILKPAQKYPFEQWNREHNLESALQYSVVWFYQDIARRVGKKRMADCVQAAEYGNQNIGGSIDSFWLQGDLRISAKQQIDFLRKLYRLELPFSERSHTIVKRISIREKNKNFIWRYKTGLTTRVEPQTGWLVGILEENKNVYYFAMNIEITRPQQAQARFKITEKIFREMNLLNRPD